MSPTTTQVRVRFAPSPTGYLHIGGARTALFNWLFARRSGGTFILRIEDTDRTREVTGSLTKILDDLRWLGLLWDEGPEMGGACGPYFQSHRREIYDSYCDRLLESERAYYAFDTADELAAMRAEARSRKRTFKYPRPASFPSADELAAAKAQGRPAVVRFRMPDEDITVEDEILGLVTLKHEELEDFVIRKADGFPTYHLACVVDDELMGITHILRGSEHLNNTPKHVAMQQALGFRTPFYAHVPIILNMNGSKMSKRDKEKAMAKGEIPPEIDVHDFRAAGYLPEVLLNFIALLGWSPGGEREKLSIDDMIESFGIERIGKTSARFDRDKLLAFNTEGAARATSGRLIAAFRDYLLVNEYALQGADDKMLTRILELCAGFRTFADVMMKAGFIFREDDDITYDPKAVKKILHKSDGEGYTVLEDLLPQFRKLDDWSSETVQGLLQVTAAQGGMGFGKVAQPLRVAVSGTTVSPTIAETLELLGKERTCRRIERCLRETPDS